MEADSGTREQAARRLVLLRHAKSSWAQDLPDHERPLNDRGRRDAAAAGRWLAVHAGRPDLVLCSSAVRTRQTWARVTEAAPEVLRTARVQVEDAIYQAWPDTLLGLLQGVREETGTVVLVGHAPGVPDLAERLSRASGEAALGDYPTSAVAVFTVLGPWAALGPETATLVTFEVPRG